MKKISVFEQIHSLEKVMLYETALLLQQTEFTKTEQLHRMEQNLEEIALLTTDYAKKQEQYILCALFEYEPSIVDIFKSDNKFLLDYVKKVSRSVEDVSLAINQEHRAEAGYKLIQLFTKFLIFQLDLIEKKREYVLNNIIWRYFSNDYIRCIQEELLQQNSCKLAGIQAKWIIKALNDADLIYWLKSVEKKGSTECMQALLSVAEEQMDEERFLKVVECVTEGIFLT